MYRSGFPNPLLRIPPFPGSQSTLFATPAAHAAPISDVVLKELAESMRISRAAGNYWACQPALPDNPYVLVRVRDRDTRLRLLGELSPSTPVVVWTASARQSPNRNERFYTVFGDCDPWALLEGATELIVDADDELALIGAIAGIQVRCVGSGAFEAAGNGRSRLLELMRGPVFGACEYFSPFTGKSISLAEALELCGFWRRLIDSNRPIAAAIGFASWKKSTVAPLLWSGGTVLTSNTRGLGRDQKVAVWKTRVPERRLDQLARSGVQLVEVEDGFIRSIGLGADCVPPLSIIVDHIGVYFDPSQPSELERCLEHGEFPPDLIKRASRLRELIVKSGISKYDVGGVSPAIRSSSQRSVLVIGQVEDDRSVRCGGGQVQSNLELLRRVRQAAPEAFIYYRPHPDVLAGHRGGHVPEGQLSGLANAVLSSGSISQSLELADEVHVNTSLAGFEALLRGKPVTTHGVPFYAGWGLTHDLGIVPARRTATRSLDELVAAVLLIYPRYLDPVTGLPCPAEILALRLAEGGGIRTKGALVRLRQLQGRLKRLLSSLRFWKSP